MKLTNSNVFAETVMYYNRMQFWTEFAYVVESVRGVRGVRGDKRVQGGIVGWPECRSLPHMPAWQRMYCNNLARHPTL